MTTLTFTVAAVYPAKEGFKTASIKTDAGKYISCWPSDAGMFQQGTTYSAVCKPFTKQDGTVTYTVMSPGKGGNIVPQGGAPMQPAPSAPQPSHNVPTAPSGPSKEETISRLAIAKSCIEAGQSQADADSWMAWVLKEPAPELAPQSPQQFETDTPETLDDEIPF